ncbi:MAG: DNA-binding protein [Actinobacteria bacterium]|nr:DNA-binding protein [Actinomycetota bacterium]
MFHVQANIGPTHVLKPAFGTDLLNELQGFVREKGINLAWISGLGAVARATLRYYDQTNKSWKDIQLEQQLEVISMLGNVSLLNGEPIVHLHVVLSDEEGRCYGGHLAANTLVFNMEILMTTLSGPPVIRKLDGDTGLTLWTSA